MISTTIITIVVVAILTAVVFGLMWFGFSSCVKIYKMEVDQGQHDADIYKEYYSRSKKGLAIKVLSFIITFILLIILITLLVFGFIYGDNKNLTIDGYTPLVIKSGSMSKFYNDDVAEEYAKLGYSKELQFGMGDICIFNKANPENLILGEVYGYKYQGIIITHRLIETRDITDDLGNIVATYYIFKGDNNPTKDQVLVSSDKILYHYIGKRIPALGAFILYAQSYFGIWSLLCLASVIISFDIVTRKIVKISQERADLIGGFYEK